MWAEIEASINLFYDYYEAQFENKTIYFIVVVKIMTPCEFATPEKSHESWDHILSLIQWVSPDNLAARGLQPLGILGLWIWIYTSILSVSMTPTIMHCSNQLQLGQYI